MTDDAHADHDHGGHDHSGHDHDGHSHGHGGASSRKLAAVALINVVGFVVELVGGLLFGSIALVSDAVHMLFDALAYITAFAASYVADRYDGSDRWSFGLHRLEPLAAFLNGALLVPMVGFILYESVQRFLHPVDIGTGPTLAIAFGGLLVNGLSVVVLEGGEMSLNERGAFYHLLGDAGGSLAVIVSVLVVDYTGIRVVDPIAAVLIAGIVLWSAGKLLRGSGAIFLQRSPLDVPAAREEIGGIAGVSRVIDFHAWQVCSQIAIATAHVEVDVETMEEAARLEAQIHDALAERGVDHATVELVSDGDDGRLRAHQH